MSYQNFITDSKFASYRVGVIIRAEELLSTGIFHSQLTVCYLRVLISLLFYGNGGFNVDFDLFIVGWCDLLILRQ